MKRRIYIAGGLPLVFCAAGCLPWNDFLSGAADAGEAIISETPLENYPEGGVVQIPRNEAGSYARRADVFNERESIVSGSLENILGNTNAVTDFRVPLELVVFFNEYGAGGNCLYFGGDIHTGGKPVTLAVWTAKPAFSYAKDTIVLGKYFLDELLYSGNLTPGISGNVGGVRDGEFGVTFGKTVDDYIFYVAVEAGPQGIPAGSRFQVRHFRMGNSQ